MKMNKFQIVTERTILRKFRKDDLEDFFLVMGNPEVMKFSLNGSYTKTKTAELIEKCLWDYQNRGYGLLAVELLEIRKVIGYCGFYHQVIDNIEEVEIGYRLNRDYWNRGLATETAKALQDAGFQVYGFDRMISIIESDNAASIRVAEKNGMTYEKDALFKNNIPVRIYSINSSD